MSLSNGSMERYEHQQRIATEFGKQAATFEDPRLNTAFTVGLPWLLDHVDPEPGWLVLDVAAGTGLVSRALAERGCRVIAVDRTAAMLLAGRPRFPPACWPAVAAAETLPFRDGTFDAVVTRFSLHHFIDPTPALAEMHRVCRTGGKIVVKDLVADPDPDVAARQDGIENLRDTSHVATPPPGAVGAWLSDLGAEVTQTSYHAFDRPLEPWLEQSRTPPDRAAKVRGALQDELRGATVTGLQPSIRDGELWFRHTWEITVATG